MIEFFTSSTFQTVLAALNSGFLKTLQLFFITLIGALPLGLIISFGSMNRWAPLGFLRKPGMSPLLNWLLGLQPISLVCRLLVWIIRGTPLVLQIIALFYVPGMQKWFSWPSGESGRMLAVCVAFIINYACYFSEIYRGGIQGVPKGQQEAGRIVPPMSNEIITLVKDTSLARVIALQEVIWMGESFMKGNSGIAGLVWPLFFTAVYYLIFSGVVTLLLGQLEKKMEFFQ